MAKYAGIRSEVMKDGSVAIMAQFKHLGVRYSKKNLTSLWGIRTEKKGFEKLQEIKAELSDKKDPFASSASSLNLIWEKKLEKNRASGEWAKSTCKNYSYFYKTHIRTAIGQKKIERITYNDIMNLFDHFKANQASSKNTLIDILRPIFNEEQIKGNITKNIFDPIKKFVEIPQKAPVSDRTHYEDIEIIRRIYNAIPDYNQARVHNIEMHQNFLYMLILSCHRVGELTKLEKKHCNLEHRIIVAPKTITKSKRDYHYPIPEECISYIENHKGGVLFPIARGGTLSRIFQRILFQAGIDTIEGHTLSNHSVRAMMMSIMINDLDIKESIAHNCLEHKPQDMKKHYHNIPYSVKAKTFKQYWDYIKEIPIENEDNKNTDANLDDLKELISNYKEGLLTKEEFEIAKKMIL